MRLVVSQTASERGGGMTPALPWPSWEEIAHACLSSDDVATTVDAILALFAPACEAASAAEAEVARLREAVGVTLPRYCEMFEALHLGDVNDSVAVQAMRDALAPAKEEK